MGYKKHKDDEELFFMQGLSADDLRNINIGVPVDTKSETINLPDIDAASDDGFITEPKHEYPKEKIAKEEKSIHKNHRKRVRDKFLQHGLDGFSEYQVLEMLLYYSISRRDTNILAHKLIDKFGSLQGVLNADYYELTEIDGISEVSASLIVFFKELNKYVRTNSHKKIPLPTTRDTGKFCCEYFYDHIDENLILLSLDLKRNLKCIDVISKGTENETAYYPRKVMKAVVKNKTNVVVLAHNHPDGTPDPSSDDLIITNRLSSMLSDIGVVVIDHIVCSGDKFLSFSDQGLLKT